MSQDNSRGDLQLALILVLTHRSWVGEQLVKNDQRDLCHSRNMEARLIPWRKSVLSALTPLMASDIKDLVGDTLL